MVGSAEDELKQRLGNLITGKAASEFSSWQPPAMEGRPINKDSVKPNDVRSSGKDVESSLKQLKEKAYQEGFQQGVNDGKREAQQHQQAQLNQLAQLIQSLAAKCEQFDEIITQQLVEMTVQLAKDIVRHELQTSPQLIVTLVNEVLAMVPTGVKNITIRLHPDDCQLVMEAYQSQNW